MFSVCFPLHHYLAPPHPFIHAALPICEYYPKRITFGKRLILAETRGFLLNRGPPDGLVTKGQKVKTGIFWYICVTTVLQEPRQKSLKCKTSKLKNRNDNNKTDI